MIRKYLITYTVILTAAVPMLAGMILLGLWMWVCALHGMLKAGLSGKS